MRKQAQEPWAARPRSDGLVVRMGLVPELVFFPSQLSSHGGFSPAVTEIPRAFRFSRTEWSQCVSPILYPLENPRRWCR